MIYEYETLRNNNDSGKPKCWKQSPSQCHFVHHKCHTDLRGANLSLRSYREANTASAKARPMNCYALTIWTARSSICWQQVPLQIVRYFAVYHLHRTKLQTGGFNIVNEYTIPIFMFRNINCLDGPGLECQ